MGSSILTSLPHTAHIPRRTSQPSKIILPSSIRIGTQTISADSLIDSGADGNFIDSTFVKTNHIPTIPLQDPIPLRLADGSLSQSGSIVQETLPLQLHLGNHIETVPLIVSESNWSSCAGLLR